MGVASGLETQAPRGLATAPSGPNSVVQVATLRESGSAVVSFVKGSTGRFEGSTCDLPARFADDDDIANGASSEGAAAIALNQNFGLYVLTDDGTRILECESASPYFLIIPCPILSVRYLRGKPRPSLPGHGTNMVADSWSNADPDSFRFQGTVV